MGDTPDIIEELIHQLLHPKPRLICICGDFSKVADDIEFAWRRCSCGGWRSDMMLANDGYYS